MVSLPDILLSLLFFLLIVVDVAGNVLVCLIVYRTRQMRKPMNYLLVNLAVADIVIGVFILPRHVFHDAFEHPRGQCIYKSVHMLKTELQKRHSSFMRYLSQRGTVTYI